MEWLVTRRGKTSREVAYAVTSLAPEQTSPHRLLALWRGHWGIENRVHWVRNVTFDEDRCMVRTGAAPRCWRPFATWLSSCSVRPAIAPSLPLSVATLPTPKKLSLCLAAFTIPHNSEKTLLDEYTYR